jgi:16S rRNA G1207 methylase RsmC
MIKHTPKRAYELLEACIGPTTTSLGWKKARLATARCDPTRACAAGVPPAVVEVEGLRIASRPNVFSWDSLDLGARRLLANLGASDRPLSAIDQGCGSGVLALALARAYPNATVLGVDESYQAVASARDNAAGAGFGEARARFVVHDDLREATDGDADLIVCNPPFHQAQAVGDHVAWGMFGQARATLARGGEYLVVGNRHLHYHEKLKRVFGRCAVIDSDKRFVVMRATRG